MLQQGSRLINVDQYTQKSEEKSHHFLLDIKYGTLHQGKSPTEFVIAW